MNIWYFIKLKNGKQNPKYVDLLEEDKPIANQKFVCVSFVSPENILKQKEIQIKNESKILGLKEKIQKFTYFKKRERERETTTSKNELEQHNFFILSLINIYISLK